ncbi:hypothetical protein FRC01_005582, partial [Tulasnella sp. 417]
MDRTQFPNQQVTNLNDPQTLEGQPPATSLEGPFRSQPFPISPGHSDDDPELGQYRPVTDEVEESAAAALEACHLDEPTSP